MMRWRSWLLAGVMCAATSCGAATTRLDTVASDVASDVALSLLPAAAPGDQAARASATAERDVSWSDGATCDTATAAALADRHPGTRQFVIVATTSFAATTATVEVVVRTADGTWRCQRSAQPARVGRTGTRPLLERRSGDGTTPAGVFPLGAPTAWDGQQFQFFGNWPDPGVRGTYRAVREQDCWGATPGTSRYHHLVNLPGCTGDDEWLTRFGDVYGHAAVIGANLDPISGDAAGEPPYAAAIFLHRHSYAGDGSTRPTSGCVSLAEADLRATITLLDPALRPHFAIGPRDWLRATA
jgi:L,D-peptidoglycan transpeptidase YkuD (ErfK/YbiS/YcfS/YnhG family)